jgi:hypothetical protein
MAEREIAVGPEIRASSLTEIPVKNYRNLGEGLYEETKSEDEDKKVEEETKEKAPEGPKVLNG